jgi:hypothetical protein
LQAVHRVRERWVRRRTAVVNQIRGLLLERGLTLPKGRWHVDNTLPDILEDATFNLSGSFRMLSAPFSTACTVSARRFPASALPPRSSFHVPICASAASGRTCIAVKQRGALTAATETLGKLYVAAAASATFCNVEISTGDSQTAPKPGTCDKTAVEG